MTFRTQRINASMHLSSIGIYRIPCSCAGYITKQQIDQLKLAYLKISLLTTGLIIHLAATERNRETAYQILFKSLIYWSYHTTLRVPWKLQQLIYRCTHREFHLLIWFINYLTVLFLLWMGFDLDIIYTLSYQISEGLT